MNTNILKPIRLWALVLCCVLLNSARAQEFEPPAAGKDTTVHAPQKESDAAQAPGDTTSNDEDSSSSDQHDDDWSTQTDSDATGSRHHHYKHHRNGNDAVVSIGHKAELPAGQHADSVVAIFGTATSAGDVDSAVVSILGSTRVTGKVGDAAVAVMGSVYVNGEVNGNVVAVMGNVELGPEARVRGDVVVIGGELTRDPAATIGGGIQRVFNTDWSDFEWLRPWVEKCLLYGRPLAFAHGLGWAWTAALGLLALYVFIAFLFRGAVDQCVQTLEAKPGQSILAALLTMLLTPVLIVLLCITVLGIAAIPFLVIGLFCVAVFGKVVVLASIGRRCTPMLANDPLVHTVVGVIVGAAIVLFLYTIPVIGFIVYKLLGLLGMGVVVYTLLISVRTGRQARAAARGPGPGGPGPGGAAYGGQGSAGSGPTSSTAGFDSNMNSTSNFGDFSASPGAGASAGAGMGAATGAGGAPGAGAATGAGGVPPGAGFTPPPAGPPPGMGASGPMASGPNGASPVSLPRAGFGIRMAALLLDVILVGILLHTIHEGRNFELIVLATYGAVMWKLKGSTVGGIICGLQVVRIDGRPIDWPTAVVRALSCFLSLAVVGLGFLWIAIDSDRQSWHDKIAGTVVVRAPKGASLL